MNDTKTTNHFSKKIEIISSIKTPLGFFSLVVLVSEAILGGVTATLENEQYKIYIIIGMLMILFTTVIIVGIVAIRNTSTPNDKTTKPKAVSVKNATEFSEHTNSIRIIESSYMQVLVPQFELSRQADGVVLNLSIKGDALAIWSREGKKLLNQLILRNEERKYLVEKYQLKLKSFFIEEGRNALVVPEHEDNDKIVFRYGSGGTLPIIRYRGTDYYCLIYREIEPIGWNLVNGGFDRCDELLHPEKAILRELNEELIIIDTDPVNGKKRRYVFGETIDYPEFILARKVISDLLHVDWDEIELHPIKNPWCSGPDKIIVEIGNCAAETTEDCYVNINASDLGIEVDKIAKFEVGDDAVFIDGELCDMPGYAIRTTVNAPIGLFDMEAMNQKIDDKSKTFEPKYIFWSGKRRNEKAEYVIKNLFMQSMQGVISPENYDAFWKSPNKFGLCPATSNLLEIYLKD